MKKEFKEGDHVPLFNSRLRIFPEKLKSRWTGPYTVIFVTTYGAIKLKLDSDNKIKFNGQHLKHYPGGEIPAYEMIRMNE